MYVCVNEHVWMYRVGQKSVTLFRAYFSALVKYTKMKFWQLINNTLTNYMTSVQYATFKRPQLASIIYQDTIYGFPPFWGSALVLEVGTYICMPEAHLRCPLCGVCWHFFDILIHTETKLLPGTGLVAIALSLKVSRSQNTSNLRSGLWGAILCCFPWRWRCQRTVGAVETFLEPYRVASDVQ